MSATAKRKALQVEARKLREKADALDRQAEEIVVEIPRPRKTKVQLEQELEVERNRRRDAESQNESLRRRLDPPDFSYFGLGDGPT